MTEKAEKTALIGVVTISDRASIGLTRTAVGRPSSPIWTRILTRPFEIVRRIIPDGFESVRDELIDLADDARCDLILTTGGTGPAPAISRPRRPRPLRPASCRASAN